MRDRLFISIFSAKINILERRGTSREKCTSWRTPRMFVQPRRERRAIVLSLFSCFFLLGTSSHAAEKARLHVDDYQIEAELAPHSHKITAKAKVKFTAL